MSAPLEAPLRFTDLMFGLASVPLRIVEREWQKEPGCPDALWIALSDGRYLLARYDAERGFMRLYCDETEIEWVESRLTGAVCHGLQRDLFERFWE